MSTRLTTLFEQKFYKDRAECPFCKEQDTRLHSMFGSQLSTSQHYCFKCRVVFEELKWEAEED